MSSDPTREPSWVTRALSWPVLALIRSYQVALSPLLPRSCRYYPSCSSYAVQAVRRFGPFVGLWLAARRLARCHPWTAGGVDHVPPRGAHGCPDWEAHRIAAARRQAELDGLDGLGAPAVIDALDPPEPDQSDRRLADLRGTS